MHSEPKCSANQGVRTFEVRLYITLEVTKLNKTMQSS